VQNAFIVHMSFKICHYTGTVTADQISSYLPLICNIVIKKDRFHLPLSMFHSTSLDIICQLLDSQKQMARFLCHSIVAIICRIFYASCSESCCIYILCSIFLLFVRVV